MKTVIIELTEEEAMVVRQDLRKSNSRWDAFAMESFGHTKEDAINRVKIQKDIIKKIDKLVKV
jgi:hypothetical protein